MTKSILVFSIVFSFLTFNLKSETSVQDTNVLTGNVAQVDEQECNEFGFDQDIFDVLDDMEEELSLAQKALLLIQFLKLKGSAAKDNVIAHVKNNKKVYVSCAVVSSLAVVVLLSRYYSQP